MAKVLCFKCQELMDIYSIYGQPATVKNPAANGLIEWVHIMITFKGSQVYDEFDKTIQTISWSICNGYDFCQTIGWKMSKLIGARETFKIEKEIKKQTQHNYSL